jgi:hypothetical protein
MTLRKFINFDFTLSLKDVSIQKIVKFLFFG